MAGELKIVVRQPKRLTDAGPLVQVWELQAFGTRYRGVAVALPSEAESVFGMGSDMLIAIEPAGGKLGLHPGRMWHAFAFGHEVLAQDYVEEKFVVQGEDAEAITLLVAAMLGRKPAFRAE